MPVEGGAARRGSQKWLQIAVNRRPEILRHALTGPVEWVSPLADDGYREYRDTAFLDRLGLSRLAPELAAFWPVRGPVWDALGKAGDRVVLVEAKAHLGEFFSPPSRATPDSRARIEAAFAEVRTALGVTAGAPWTDCFYQYANRLAHLHFLRRQGIEAVLLLVDFVNDADMGGPTRAAEWRAAYRAADYVLGLPREHRLSRYVVHVCPDVRDLGAAEHRVVLPAASGQTY